MNEITPPIVVKTEAKWRQLLTPEQYHILRENGTEPAFSGKYYDHYADGIYHCAACDNPLFSSVTKFASGTGWPSFYDPLASTSVNMREDSYLFIKRIEVICQRCGSHLGHVFKDGPNPIGLRYCINSLALDFKPG